MRLASREKNVSMISFRTSRRSSICVASLQAVSIAIVLTNSRQGIADEHVHYSATAISCRYEHCARRLRSHLADDQSILSTFRLMKCVQSYIGIFRCNDG